MNVRCVGACACKCTCKCDNVHCCMDTHTYLQLHPRFWVCGRWHGCYGTLTFIMSMDYHSITQ